jgi:hypothetical protein
MDGRGPTPAYVYCQPIKVGKPLIEGFGLPISGVTRSGVRHYDITALEDAVIALKHERVPRRCA